MSLCRLYSIHSPVNWRSVPREGYNVRWTARASGERSASRRARSQGENDGGGGGGVGGSSLWDSNVENVRRRSRNRSEASPPEWLTPKKDWTFNSDEKRSEEEQWNRPDEDLPWWKSTKADNKESEDESEDDEDNDDDDEEDDDSDRLLSSLRWGIPVSFVVLPWLLGNPVILLLGLAAVPAVQRAFGPVVSEVWQALLRLSGTSPPKRRRKAEDAYASWASERDTSQPYRYKRPASDGKYSADVGSSSNRSASGGGRSVGMGGWEDLEADRRGRVPVRSARKSSKLGWKSKRKEKPLLVRLLVALFPFLRNWGGWLSIFLLFPLLEGNPFT